MAKKPASPRWQVVRLRGTQQPPPSSHPTQTLLEARLLGLWGHTQMEEKWATCDYNDFMLPKCYLCSVPSPSIDKRDGSTKQAVQHVILYRFLDFFKGCVWLTFLWKEELRNQQVFDLFPNVRIFFYVLEAVTETKLMTQSPETKPQEAAYESKLFWGGRGFFLRQSFTKQFRLALNSQRSACLCLLSAGFKGMCHAQKRKHLKKHAVDNVSRDK